MAAPIPPPTLWFPELGVAELEVDEVEEVAVVAPEVPDEVVLPVPVVGVGDEVEEPVDEPDDAVDAQTTAVGRFVTPLIPHKLCAKSIACC